MASNSISIRNATQHNLKGVSVDIPHHQLTVVTGPSGSGKSSLAFDTLYAEGQRRYIESLSTYAKQFLERMPKPATDHIDGIAPAVAIEQKNPTTSTRSTVGTATEIQDYLRLLWARVATPLCSQCGGAVLGVSGSTGAERLVEQCEGEQLTITFPLPRSGALDHAAIVETLGAMGFVRIVVNGTPCRLDGLPPRCRLDRAKEVLVAVDRVSATSSNRGRLAESLALAFTEGDGIALVLREDSQIRLSQRPQCQSCARPSVELTPALFSFNNPRGACDTCNGFGAVLEYDESLIVPNPGKTLADGALDPWTKPRYTNKRALLRETADREGIPFDQPWRGLTNQHRQLLLDGKSGRFVGVFPFLRDLERKRYKQYIRVFLRQYQKARLCTVCLGARLCPDALAAVVGDKNIAEVSALTAASLKIWLDTLQLAPFQKNIASSILRELSARVLFLNEVGLEYLTLDRQTRTLSGGEAQRISLANALGSQLVDTLYVLDEPTIGLHPRDVDRMVGMLTRLRDAGNTVVLVEHDPAVIEQADYLVELGPGSGTKGGEIVFAGPSDDPRAAHTLTGRYLSGATTIPVPTSRRSAGPRWITMQGACLHNLDHVNMSIPLGTLTVVTGVSGSGKSTLIHDVLYRQLSVRLTGTHRAKEHLGEAVGTITSLSGWEAIREVVLIDQSPIGRTPRSNPITYVRAFDDIRQLFANQPLAKARGYTPTTFSFNTAGGGRCPDCEGAGHIVVEMVFLADVFVPCERCGATRYDTEVLDVKIKGQNIHHVLQLTVDEAILRFRHQDKLGRALWHLQQVGLGYLTLGQPATTLSGGEAQRLKIARHLTSARKKPMQKLYILDEPTTGLHVDDVRVLLKVFDRLVDAGNTVVVIEHNLDIIKRADWIIDMGPDGGQAGGRVVAEGTPEAVAQTNTHTAGYLSAELAAAASTSAVLDLATAG